MIAIHSLILGQSHVVFRLATTSMYQLSRQRSADTRDRFQCPDSWVFIQYFWNHDCTGEKTWVLYLERVFDCV